MQKTKTILKCPVNKLFPIKNTYKDTNETGIAREQKLRQEAAIIGEPYREKMNVNCVNIGERSLIIANMNLLIRFNKAREIFLSVTRVLSILLSTLATTTAV